MPAVFIAAQLAIHDPVRYGRYVDRFAATLRGFDAELLVADGQPEILEGEWSYDKFVLIRFSGRQEADRWATSSAYRAIAGDREAATSTTAVLLRGVR
jgi:uncharacterized protein (DUF1330 family)